VIEHLERIEKGDGKGGPYFLSTALIHEGLYKEIWYYWRKMFLYDDDILERMLRIETLLESRICEGAIKKELAGWVAVYALKMKHRWEAKEEEEEKPQPARKKLVEFKLAGGRKLEAYDRDE
jgi:hypothetical protein